MIEAKFEKGKIPDGKVKILFSNGQYYEGPWESHMRQTSKKKGTSALGRCIYPNGDVYDG